MQAIDCLTKFNLALSTRQYRGLVVLKGELKWAKNLLFGYLLSILEEADIGENITLTSLVDAEYKLANKDTELGQENDNFSALNSCVQWQYLTSKTFTHHLGTECDYLFVAEADLHLDALAALIGTIKAGGLCFLWLPPEINSQLDTSSNFTKRLLNKLENNAGCCVIEQHKVQQPALPEVNSPLSPCSLFEQQLNAINQIKALATKRAHRPLVLTADRGRGKSTALALACVELLKKADSNKRFVICAPHQAATNIFFSHLTANLNGFSLSAGKFEYQGHSIEFMPADQLLRQSAEQVGLLLVDEAAGIPVYLLAEMAARFKRIVFSSTVHGYEGAGRGFSIKFLPKLKALSNSVTYQHLEQPIRWQQGDWLEHFINDLCLFNADIADITETRLQSSTKLSFQLITKPMLMANEQLLAQVFAILVTAHYQTKPSDLKLLLDNDAMQVFALIDDNTLLLAVALTVTEGGLDKNSAIAVKNGERRFKNQFTPQVLCTNGIYEQAFSDSFLRVVRIAVHPELQQQGLGTELLNQIEMWAKSQQIDWLSTSFAANKAVTSFWLKAELMPSWLSFTQDAASGEFSLLMTKAMTKDKCTQHQVIIDSFYQSFSYLLARDYQQMRVDLVALILAQSPINHSSDLSLQDNELLTRFANGKLLLGPASFTIAKWLFASIKVAINEDRKPLLPLVSYFLLNKQLTEVVKQFSFSGRKAFERYVQQQIKLGLKVSN